MNILRYLLLLFCVLIGDASSQTVGLLSHDQGSDSGYSMISKGGTAYLLDTGGQILHAWDHGTNSRHPGYLQNNGDWIAVNKGFKWYDWDGNLIWEYSNQDAHHDIAIKPNGNVLLLVWGDKSNSEAIAAGRDPSLLTDGLRPMMIYEVNKKGELVWEWHVWDHLIQDYDSTVFNYGVVENHPELIDINYVRSIGSDWLHGNSIDYNPLLEQILVSPRFINELWIIDNSTTTVEASGHVGGKSGRGGDLLYRWGNPEVYRANGPQMNFGGHDAQWIKPGLPGEGNILFFNNGGFSYGRDGNYSSVDEITPPLNGYNYDLLKEGIFGPTHLTWSYQKSPRDDFFSSFISGAQRLSNGSTFINEGDKGYLFEISNDGMVLWEYQNPIANDRILFQGENVPFAPSTSLFRATRYSKDHSAFIGRDLRPQGTIEQYDKVNSLSIASSNPELHIYPKFLQLELGEGQKIPLIISETKEFILDSWTVISGIVEIDDLESSHAELIMGTSDVAIMAKFIKNTDWIFLHGFEN